MNRLYIILFFIMIFCFTYFAGIHAGVMRCRANRASDTSQQQTKIIEIQGEINAETVRRAGDDIRRILYEKYTIAE